MYSLQNKKREHPKHKRIFLFPFLKIKSHLFIHSNGIYGKQIEMEPWIFVLINFKKFNYLNIDLQPFIIIRTILNDIR